MGWLAQRMAILGPALWIAGGNSLAIGAPAIGCAISKEHSSSLPLAAAAAERDIRNYDLSPDGQWVAYEYAEPGETVAYSLHVRLVEIKSLRTIELGASRGVMAMAPVWSPDSQNVAFFSDASGGLALWVWNLASKKAMQIPDTSIRFEDATRIKWLNGRQLVAVLPALIGRSHFDSESSAERSAGSGIPRIRFPAGRQSATSVLVHHSDKDTVVDERAVPVPGVEADLGCQSFAEDCGGLAFNDLALIDVADHSISRIASQIPISWFAPSPDGRFVAYTTPKGWAPNAQQGLHDLDVFDVSSGSTRVLGNRLMMSQGDTVSWSHSGEQLAYLTQGQIADGRMSVVSIPAGTTITFGSKLLPSFNYEDIAQTTRAPLWSEDDKKIFAIESRDRVWSIDSSTGAGLAFPKLAGKHIQGIVSWTSSLSSTSRRIPGQIYLTTIDEETIGAGVFELDSNTGYAHKLAEAAQHMSLPLGMRLTNDGRFVVYVASDQVHASEIWRLDVVTGKTMPITGLNAELTLSGLGRARIIRWTGVRGETLRGSLLLPPGPVRQHPLVVWLYGGASGSESLNRYGLWSNEPVFNLQVLASRGYAVLFPDAPLREGRTVADLLSVMPGVDEAIRLGYADPERLALMGQSYGSFSVLGLLTLTNRFKAAIISAVANPDLLSAYVTSLPGFATSDTGYFEHGQGNMGGTPWQYPDRYRENSPIHHFDAIQTPILMGQGSADPLFIVGAPDSVFVALNRLGKSVEYRLYGGEDHVIQMRRNVIDFWERRLSFRAERLNPPCQAHGVSDVDDRGCRRSTSGHGYGSVGWVGGCGLHRQAIFH